MPALHFTLWDGISAGLVLALALLLLLRPVFSASPGRVCVVTWDGGELTLPLSEDTVLELESRGYSLTVEINDGSAAVIHSDCPDGVCTGTGEIRSGGSVIVCVPADVVIRIPQTDEQITEDFRVG